MDEGPARSNRVDSVILLLARELVKQLADMHAIPPLQIVVAGILGRIMVAGDDGHIYHLDHGKGPAKSRDKSVTPHLIKWAAYDFRKMRPLITQWLGDHGITHSFAMYATGNIITLRVPGGSDIYCYITSTPRVEYLDNITLFMAPDWMC